MEGWSCWEIAGRVVPVWKGRVSPSTDRWKVRPLPLTPASGDASGCDTEKEGCGATHAEKHAVYAMQHDGSCIPVAESAAVDTGNVIPPPPGPRPPSAKYVATTEFTDNLQPSVMLVPPASASSLEHVPAATNFVVLPAFLPSANGVSKHSSLCYSDEMLVALSEDGVWAELVDPKTSYPYFVCLQTLQTVWSRPRGLIFFPTTLKLREAFGKPPTGVASISRRLDHADNHSDGVRASSAGVVVGGLCPDEFTNSELARTYLASKFGGTWPPRSASTPVFENIVIHPQRAPSPESYTSREISPQLKFQLKNYVGVSVQPAAVIRDDRTVVRAHASDSLLSDLEHAEDGASAEDTFDRNEAPSCSQMVDLLNHDAEAAILARTGANAYLEDEPLSSRQLPSVELTNESSPSTLLSRPAATSSVLHSRVPSWVLHRMGEAYSSAPSSSV